MINMLKVLIEKVYNMQHQMLGMYLQRNKNYIKESIKLYRYFF